MMHLLSNTTLHTPSTCAPYTCSLLSKRWLPLHKIWLTEICSYFWIAITLIGATSNVQNGARLVSGEAGLKELILMCESSIPMPFPTDNPAFPLAIISKSCGHTRPPSPHLFFQLLEACLMPCYEFHLVLASLSPDILSPSLSHPGVPAAVVVPGPSLNFTSFELILHSALLCIIL